jgi:hypothetical protein
MVCIWVNCETVYRECYYLLSSYTPEVHTSTSVPADQPLVGKYSHSRNTVSMNKIISFQSFSDYTKTLFSPCSKAALSGYSADHMVYDSLLDFCCRKRMSLWMLSLIEHSAIICGLRIVLLLATQPLSHGLGLN